MISLRPVVSVCMITYNHEKYIRQAVESVMAQKVNFSVELVIGDDCSTDGTGKILMELSKEYPGKIKLLTYEKNVGHMENLARVFNKKRGKYVACLEGDDYWTDPDKLQKQVDILERNSRLSMVSHITNVVYESIDKESHVFGGFVPEPDICTTEEVIRHLFSHLSSMMFRAKYIKRFPGWFYYCYSGDMALALILSHFGSIYHIKEVMSIYRVHSGGMHTKKREDNKDLLMNYFTIFSHFDVYTRRKYHEKITTRLFQLVKKLYGEPRLN